MRHARRPSLCPYTTLFRSAKVRATLWAAANELRANSKLTPVQYRDPVLGLVFLAYAENRFEEVRSAIEANRSVRNPAQPADYKRSEEHTSELQSRENLVCR